MCQNSQSLSVDGCHTVMCSSVPAAACAVLGIGTASNSACMSGA